MIGGVLLLPTFLALLLVSLSAFVSVLGCFCHSRGLNQQNLFEKLLVNGSTDFRSLSSTKC